jgi:hypothetical protein
MFEEHMVLAHLDPLNLINNSFGLREKVRGLAWHIQTRQQVGLGWLAHDAGSFAAGIANRAERLVALTWLDICRTTSYAILTRQVFNFGTVIARLPEPGVMPGNGGGLASGQQAGGKPEGRSLAAKGAGVKSVKVPKGGSGGSLAAAGAGGASPGSGGGGGEGAAAGEDAPKGAGEDASVKANLKFTNNGKVPCTVNFTIKPKGTVPAGRFPMEVSPSNIAILPNESRWAAEGLLDLAGSNLL